MSTTTRQRRSLRRNDTRRRPNRVGTAATLFDPISSGPVAAPAAPVDTGHGDDAAAAPTEAVGAIAGGETLDHLVVGGWDRLVARAETPCLLCGGTMEPRYGAHAAPIGGRCRDCGTTLS